MTALVRDWMTPTPQTVSLDTTLNAAYKIMQAGGFRHLPIVAGERLIGLVSKRDIRRARLQIAAAYAPGDMQTMVGKHKTVGEIMEYHPQTVQGDQGIGEACSLMLESHLTALPVTENGRLVGILTESDVLKMVIKQDV